MGLAAQDYLNDHVLDDTDSLYTGWTDWVSDSAIEPVKKLKTARVWHENGIAHVTLAGDACAQLLPNGFVNLPTALADDEQFALGGRVTQISHSTKGTQASLVSVRNFMLPKTAIWGVNARNLQQNAALDLLMNPDIDFVSLLGQAGTGKTLLALAAGLAQVMDKRLYSEIILTRATVPVGDDIGFLPGTEEEKMAPWMGAVEDNLEVLLGSNTATGSQSISQSSNGFGSSGFGSKLGNSSHGAWGASASMDMVRSRIKIKSMAFMRGRTFQAKFVIVDEAQNLTPKQMKTLITRAGPGTKLVCLGNIAQIDTPYLTEASSGISFVVDRMKGWPHGGHMTLLRGERSRLADFASEVL